MVLDSLYTALFRPRQAPIEIEGAAGAGIFAVLAVSLALPDAGRLQAGGWGAFGLFMLLFALCLAGWFWVGSAMTLLAKLAGGKGTVEATLGAIAQACWPLLLLAPAVAAGNAGLPEVKQVAAIAIALWVAALLIAFVRRVHGLSWSRSLAAWLLLVGAGALTALVLTAAAGVLAVILIS